MSNKGVLKRPDVQTTELTQSYLDGASLRELARRTGLSLAGVRNRLQLAGIKRRRPGGQMKSWGIGLDDDEVDDEKELE